MKPLILLIAVTLICLFSLRVIQGKSNYALSARIGISVMFIFTAIGHFFFAEGMALMIPEFIPFKKELVYLTALIELFAAIGLHLQRFRLPVAWLLILFLLLLIPANVNATIHHLNFQTGTFDGSGPMYLWFRIPLQILFIIWIYLSSIK